MPHTLPCPQKVEAKVNGEVSLQQFHFVLFIQIYKNKWHA